MLAGATEAREAVAGELSSAPIQAGGSVVLWVGRGLLVFCSGDGLDGPGMLGVVVLVSSSTYKVMEESRRRRLGQCWWIWNQA